MRLQVSVVVPTYCRPALLRRCLHMLAAQDIGHECYEVIVADDANDPLTKDIVRSEGSGSCRMRYVEVGPTHGPAAARNAGWRASSGTIVAFTDDDTVPSPSWLSQGAAAFDAGAGAVWGKTIVPLPKQPTDFQLNLSGLEAAGFITANCFIRRDIVERVGGFDESFRKAWREDSEMFFRLLENQITVRHAPLAVVVHPVKAAPWGISMRQQVNNLWDALLFKKHPDFFIRYIQRNPPFMYYAATGFSLATLISLFSGYLMAAGLCGALWASLSGLFFLRRLRRTTHSAGHVAEMALTSIAIPPIAIFWRVMGALRFRTAFL